MEEIPANKQVKEGKSCRKNSDLPRGAQLKLQVSPDKNMEVSIHKLKS